MGRPVSRERRRVLGSLLLAIATAQEGNSLTLARLQGMHMTQMTPKEAKAIRAAAMLNDRSVRVLRVLGNRLEQS